MQETEDQPPFHVQRQRTLSAGDKGILGTYVDIGASLGVWKQSSKALRTSGFSQIPCPLKRLVDPEFYFEILMFPFMNLYGAFSCCSLVQIPLIYAVGEALENQKLHICTSSALPGELEHRPGHLMHQEDKVQCQTDHLNFKRKAGSSAGAKEAGKIVSYT